MVVLENPKRQIMCPEDLENFQNSPVYQEFLEFITSLNGAVKGKEIGNSHFKSSSLSQNTSTSSSSSSSSSAASASASAALSPNEVMDSFKSSSNSLMMAGENDDGFIQRMESILVTLMDLVRAFPPLPHKGRFGNPQFRNWIDFVQLHGASMIRTLHSSESPDDGIDDDHLLVYFLSSFGHRQRIDYGTGNESLFMAFLLICQKCRFFNQSQHEEIVLVVFRRYLQLMRLLQFTYWLEPAGSHGVWGLDDYHFLPFLFGSSQLIGHRYIKPKSIHDQEVVEAYASQYFYLGSISFVNQVKNASLKWHSPMLDDISGVKTWDKINSGMIKMYRGDVLAKYPIMQHFLFGHYLPFETVLEITTQEQRDRQVKYMFDQSHEEICDHRMPGELPSCCVMKVPSAIPTVNDGAALRNVNRREFSLPFD